jgi:hypothetical protein
MKTNFPLYYFLLSFLYFGCSPKTSKLIFNTALQQDQYEAVIKAYREKNEKDFVLYNSDKPTFSASSFLSNLEYYPINAEYRCDCDFILAVEKQMVEMATYAGTTKLYSKYGIANCKLKDNEVKLTLFKQVGALPVYQNLLFLPIKDMTSGDGSYGGGRYLNLDINEIIDNKISIDFNKAYNPWCAYSGGFTCPIPPKENQIMMEIPVGEKDYIKQ